VIRPLSESASSHRESLSPYIESTSSSSAGSAAEGGVELMSAQAQQANTQTSEEEEEEEVLKSKELMPQTSAASQQKSTKMQTSAFDIPPTLTKDSAAASSTDVTCGMGVVEEESKIKEVEEQEKVEDEGGGRLKRADVNVAEMKRRDGFKRADLTESEVAQQKPSAADTRGGGSYRKSSRALALQRLKTEGGLLGHTRNGERGGRDRSFLEEAETESAPPPPPDNMEDAVDFKAKITELGVRFSRSLTLKILGEVPS
jgi:hypothetical protein